MKDLQEIHVRMASIFGYYLNASTKMIFIQVTLLHIKLHYYIYISHLKILDNML